MECFAALCSSSHFAVSVLSQWPLDPFFAGTLEKSLVCFFCLSPKSPYFSTSHCIPFAELLAGCCFPLTSLASPFLHRALLLPAQLFVMPSCPHSFCWAQRRAGKLGCAAGRSGVVWLVHPVKNPAVWKRSCSPKERSPQGSSCTYSHRKAPGAGRLWNAVPSHPHCNFFVLWREWLIQHSLKMFLDPAVGPSTCLQLALFLSLFLCSHFICLSVSGSNFSSSWGVSHVSVSYNSHYSFWPCSR